MIKVKKKYTAFYMVIILMINFVIGTMPVAANENDDILNHLTTTVTIRDADTGEMTSYKINNHKLKVSESQNGSVSTLVIHDIGSTIEDSQLQRSPSQSNSDTIYGWKGNVRITWYQDGTWARLISAGGDWTKVSGNYTMTNKSIRYGQTLGTNSRSGSASFVNSYNVAPSWPNGKYGQGHFVGANISGKVNNKYVDIVCNYTLF